MRTIPSERMTFIGLYILSTVGFIAAFQIRVEPYRTLAACGVFVILFAMFLRIQHKRRKSRR